MKIFVDIDGTICKTTNGDYEGSVPMLDRIETINKLYEQGNTIVYWTARGMRSGRVPYLFQLTYRTLQNWGAKFHELRMGKPDFDLYICDKVICAKSDWPAEEIHRVTGS